GRLHRDCRPLVWDEPSERGGREEYFGRGCRLSPETNVRGRHPLVPAKQPVPSVDQLRSYDQSRRRPPSPAPPRCPVVPVMKKSSLIFIFAGLSLPLECSSQIQQAWVNRYSLNPGMTNQSTALALSSGGCAV